MLNVLRPLLLVAALAVALPLAAQDAAPAPAPPQAQTQAPVQPSSRIEVRSQREDAGARVRQVERAGGRVLQAEPMQRGGQEVYRFKVLTPEGRVRVTQGDPRDAGTDPFREERLERRREQLGFDRRSELTARRREFGDDAAAEAPRERDQRQETRRSESSRPPRAGDRNGD